jgi:Fe-S-cluster containining protein
MVKIKGKREEKPWPCQRCGKCCVAMAMPASLIEKHRDKFQRPVLEEHPSEIAPGVFSLSIITENAICVFLTKDNLCAIYEDRPIVCKKFGQSSGVLECAKVTMSGRVRSQAEYKKAYERLIKLEQAVETPDAAILRGYDIIHSEENE